MDMALDEVIAKEKSSNPGRRGGRGRGRGGRGSGRGSGRGGGAVRRRNNKPTPFNDGRRSGGADADRWDHSGWDNEKNPGRSNQSRAPASGEDGYRVLIDNLKFDVLEDDLESLFSTVGKVEKVKVYYDKSGRSKGRGLVVFKSLHHAEQAVKEYDGRSIEGQPMSVTLGGQVEVKEPKRSRADRNTKWQHTGGGERNSSNSSNTNTDTMDAEDLNFQIKVSF